MVLPSFDQNPTVMSPSNEPPSFLNGFPFSPTARKYRRPLVIVYLVMSSGAENAIHLLSGEKLTPLSGTSKLVVSRSIAPDAASSRDRSALRFGAVMLRS